MTDTYADAVKALAAEQTRVAEVKDGAARIESVDDGIEDHDPASASYDLRAHAIETPRFSRIVSSGLQAGMTTTT